MHVLVIGGTRFVGYQLVWRLLLAGHQVTTFNRGRLPDPFGERVERLHGDRIAPDFARLLTGRHFDAAVDFAGYTADDARQAVAVLGGQVGHYVFISSGQVYLVRQDCRRPSREEDYAGPLLPEPEDPDDRKNWRSGIDKRQAEDVLANAWMQQGFPATRLRLPMVNGERDPFRRVESYLWRLSDGGPLLIPDSSPSELRHVYSGDVVQAIIRLLGDDRTFGEAYNLAQYEAPALVDLVTLLAGLLATSPKLVSVTDEELRSHGLTATQVSPFSDRWTSHLDMSKALRSLAFHPEHLRRCLDKIVSSFLSHPPMEPPPNYANRRAELALAAHLLSAGRATTLQPDVIDANPVAGERPASQKELARLLGRYGVETTTLAPLYDGRGDTVYRLVVRGEKAVATWQMLYNLVAISGYWPVLLGDEGQARRHAASMEVAEQDGWGPWQSPSEIIADAEAINVPVWLHTKIDEVSGHFPAPHGAWPDEEALRAVQAAHNTWLQAPPDNEIDVVYHLSIETGRRGLVPLIYLALVPTRHGWQVPAYLRLGGWNEAPKFAEHTAVLKRWSQRFGADVLAMQHDTVELLMRRPPTTREEALTMAWEYWGYSGECLPGEYDEPTNTIEGLAAMLMLVRVWHFWWD